MPTKWKSCIKSVTKKQSPFCIKNKFPREHGCYNPYAICSKLRQKSYKKSMKSQEIKKPFKLYKSSISSKKWSVYIPTTRGNLKKVSYGASGMSDYTIHHDKDRRERYRQRHINDHIKDPYKAGFWSWWHLWGESSDSEKAFKNAVSKAKKLI